MPRPIRITIEIEADDYLQMEFALVEALFALRQRSQGATSDIDMGGSQTFNWTVRAGGAASTEDAHGRK